VGDTLPPTQLLIFFPPISPDLAGESGELKVRYDVGSYSLGVKELLSLYNPPPHPSSSQAPALSRNETEGRGERSLTQQQGRGKWLLSKPSLLISAQGLPLPISLMNKGSCKSSEVNYRTED